MAKAEAVAKPTYKVRLRMNAGDTATIFRGEGLPFIDDKTENAVKWLADKGYQANDIEIIGKKPDIWETVYPAPKAAEPEPVIVPAAEPVAAV